MRNGIPKCAQVEAFHRSKYTVGKVLHKLTIGPLITTQHKRTERWCKQNGTEERNNHHDADNPPQLTEHDSRHTAHHS